MRYNRKLNFAVILIFLGVIVSFAYLYNSYVTQVVTDAAYNDREILQNYNNEIIRKLVSQESEEGWALIIEQYGEIVVKIENSDNMVVAQTQGRNWTALDVKVSTPFEYHGEAYMIRSSVYLLRDYVADVRGVVGFVFVEFLIGLSALCLLIFVIYNAMLRPYKVIYRAIEEYDKNGNLNNANLKGYAGRVYNRFRSLTENLEKQHQNQQRIIASISHDIKTPLTSIMGYAERLSKDNISEERRTRYLDTVYGKSLEIQHLVNEFDEYLSFNISQQFSFEKTTANIIAAELLENYEAEMELLGVDFSVSNRAGKAGVYIDRIKIKRVFDNIFNNSVKHFKDGKKVINVDISSSKDKLFIKISDNGKGVEEEKLDVIFEPLYTSDQGRKVAGLGLAICREIIDGHEGKIYASESELGGLAVWIELDRKANYD